jgi:hypothetical protein
MPYEYRIDRDAHRIHVLAFGPSTFEEGCEAAERLVADPEFIPALPILCDARRLEYLATYQEALAYRDMFERLRASFRGPIAMVVEGTARYGVTRMVASLAQLAGVQIEAFRSIADAEVWLAAHAAPPPA